MREKSEKRRRRRRRSNFESIAHTREEEGAKNTRAKIQGTRMFSNNLQHKQLYRWLCNKTTKSTDENILDDPTPYITIVSSNGNSITYNNNFDTINENDQNSVSPQWNKIFSKKKCSIQMNIEKEEKNI